MTPSDQPQRATDGISGAADAPSGGPAGESAGEDGRRPGAGSWRRLVRGRRRPWVVATAVIAGLAVLAASADLLIAHTARERIARAASCRLKPVGRVSAELSGSLAGLRILTGHVGTVRIRAEDVERDDMDLTVTAELHQVTTKGAMSGGSATATLAYDELGKQLTRGGAGLRPGPDGHGGLVLTGTVVGIPLPVTVHTSIRTGRDSVTVTPTDVDVLGRNIPVAQARKGKGGSGLAAQLAPRTVKAPQLPAGVVLTGARTNAQGLALSLSVPASVSSGGAKGCAA
ncbi:LmeA family phospholipid-binding protein [Actinacidiphila sp. bgisy144]|uniref:LmeA family phospholipid-binding protein n=1 Tax=Actinacidiphila sp. bgisy144 TaxID=3413791 RepID=UPI003EB7A4CE